MIKDKEEEVADFKEAEAEPMGKVAYLTMQCKITKIHNGKKNLLENRKLH